VYGNVNRRLTNPESLRSVTIAGMASGAVQVIFLDTITENAKTLTPSSTRYLELIFSAD
jgi:hypothetical protein